MDERSDLLRQIRMAGVVGVYAVGADQLGPTDEPAFADRVDEHRPDIAGLTAEDVARHESEVPRKKLQRKKS